MYFKFFNYLVYSQLVGAYHSAGYAFSFDVAVLLFDQTN